MYCGLVAEDPEDIAAVIESPCAPGDLKAFADKATKIEVWHTSFTDDGPDYDEYKVFGADGNLLDTFKTTGY